MANIKMQVILLFARGYKFPNKDTGEVLEGVKIQYYSDDNLLPLEDKETGVFGNQVMADTIAYSNLEAIKSVPGLYSCTCSMSNVKAENGNIIPRLKVDTLKFVSDFRPKEGK